ncbi:AMP-dependent synthetase [Niastella koreensis]|uniref:AMP-dependent synthetase and ligase n=2 Tax=Niastella koreensis TaxID=354356 RepID=G8T8D7_NIAKG|nr:AMP-binding protein [Niastella koreensis]AEV99107.1 AMP-dependent synthetase and ligase [Niastella koreensis GR20-10]OQP44018.1 AMP-dependent synthetase [Niastella koreensis]
MTLYEHILNNKDLFFIDAQTGHAVPVRSFHQSLPVDNRQGLVFIYNDNSIASAEVLLNFLNSPFTVVLLSVQLHPSFKQNLEALYTPCYIYDPGRVAAFGYNAVVASLTIQLLKRKTPAEYDIHSNIKLLLSTSGSTGSPKFVKLSNENLVQNAFSILDYMPIKKTDVVPLNVPIVFVYGLSIFTTNCMAAGSILCTNKDLLQPGFWTDFTKYQCSTIGGVPYVYEMLQRIGFFKKDHPSLRYMTQTGGILNQALRQEIVRYVTTYNKQFIAQYGQTEAAGRMAWLPQEQLLTKAASIGRPIKNGSFEIDADTSELIYYGPNVFGGYVNSPADLSSWHKTDKLYTGDVARQDEEGYYYITGRIKRIIKLFGSRLNLDEIELILKNAMGGQTVVCTGINDKYLLVTHVNDQLETETIKQLLKEKLNIHPTAVQVKYLPSMPLTSNGKIDYMSISLQA